jgi:hypothetical protein
VIEIIEASFCPREKIIHYPNYCEKIIKKIMQYIKLLLVVLFAVLLGSIAARRSRQRRVLSRRALGAAPQTMSGTVTVTTTQQVTSNPTVNYKLSNPTKGTLCINLSSLPATGNCHFETKSTHKVTGPTGTLLSQVMSTLQTTITTANKDVCFTGHQKYPALSGISVDLYSEDYVAVCDFKGSTLTTQTIRNG